MRVFIAAVLPVFAVDIFARSNLPRVQEGDDKAGEEASVKVSVGATGSFDGSSQAQSSMAEVSESDRFLTHHDLEGAKVDENIMDSRARFSTNVKNVDEVVTGGSDTVAAGHSNAPEVPTGHGADDLVETSIAEAEPESSPVRDHRARAKTAEATHQDVSEADTIPNAASGSAAEELPAPETANLEIPPVHVALQARRDTRGEPPVSLVEGRSQQTHSSKRSHHSHQVHASEGVHAQAPDEASHRHSVVIMAAFGFFVLTTVAGATWMYWPGQPAGVDPHAHLHQIHRFTQNRYYDGTEHTVSPLQAQHNQQTAEPTDGDRAPSRTVTHYAAETYAHRASHRKKELTATLLGPTQSTAEALLSDRYVGPVVQDA